MRGSTSVFARVLVAVSFLGISLVNGLRAEVSNVLTNPGFETGNFSGWTVGGNSLSTGVNNDGTLIPNTNSPFTPAFVNVRSGNFAGFALIKDGIDPVERITLSQTVPVLPNETVLVGFWLGNDSQSAFGMQLNNSHTQIFIDGFGLLSNPYILIPIGSSPSAFTLISGTFDTGSRTSVDVTFAINGSGTSRDGASFDDFYFNSNVEPTIPEPSSLVIWLGVLAISLPVYAWRRRTQLAYATGA